MCIFHMYIYIIYIHIYIHIHIYIYTLNKYTCVCVYLYGYIYIYNYRTYYLYIYILAICHVCMKSDGNTCFCIEEMGLPRPEVPILLGSFKLFSTALWVHPQGVGSSSERSSFT